MSSKSVLFLGLINAAFMAAAFYYGFAAGKEHNRILSSLKQDAVQIRYPIERVDTARLDESTVARSLKQRKQ